MEYIGSILYIYIREYRVEYIGSVLYIYIREYRVEYIGLVQYILESTEWSVLVPF